MIDSWTQKLTQSPKSFREESDLTNTSFRGEYLTKFRRSHLGIFYAKVSRRATFEDRGFVHVPTRQEIWKLTNNNNNNNDGGIKSTVICLKIKKIHPVHYCLAAVWSEAKVTTANK